MDGVGQEKEDGRRYPRWATAGRLVARIVGIPKVSVVDISRRGALIEHMRPFRLETVSFLTLSLPA